MYRKREGEVRDRIERSVPRMGRRGEGGSGGLIEATYRAGASGVQGVNPGATFNNTLQRTNLNRIDIFGEAQRGGANPREVRGLPFVGAREGGKTSQGRARCAFGWVVTEAARRLCIVHVCCERFRDRQQLVVGNMSGKTRTRKRDEEQNPSFQILPPLNMFG
jgi:hypothetical protein